MNAQIKIENERELQREVAPESHQDLSASGVRPIVKPAHVAKEAKREPIEALAQRLYRALL